MEVIGIDPGTTQIGYGIIEKNGNDYKVLDCGRLKIESQKTDKRLLEVEKEMESLLEKSSPDKAGIEKIFFQKNKKTAIKVAHARGIIIRTLTDKNISLFEISPSEAKASVTSDGNASKEAVAKMVGYFLNIDTSDLKKDTTDALAIAITAANKNENIQKNIQK